MENNKSRSRTEMINILSKVTCATQLCWLPTEGCLECSVFTGEGYSYVWISETAWPAILIKGLDYSKQLNLIKKIKDNTLSAADIDGTQLMQLYNDYSSNGINNEIIPIPKFFSNLQYIVPESDGRLYCICLLDDEYESTGVDVFFYSKYDMFVAAFKEKVYFAKADSRWTEMSDEEVKYWSDLVESGELNSIYCLEYDMEQQ